MDRTKIEGMIKQMHKFKLKKKKEEDDDEEDIEEIHTLKIQKSMPLLYGYVGGKLDFKNTHHDKNRGEFYKRKDEPVYPRVGNDYTKIYKTAHKRFDEMLGHHDDAPFDYAGDLPHLDMDTSFMKQDGLLLWEDNPEYAKKMEDGNYWKDRYNWGGGNLLPSTFN